MPCLIKDQTIKMTFQVESFLCPDKQGSPEEDQRIQLLKCYVSTYQSKDDDNSLKYHN